MYPWPSLLLEIFCKHEYNLIALHEHRLQIVVWSVLEVWFGSSLLFRKLRTKNKLEMCFSCFSNYDYITPSLREPFGVALQQTQSRAHILKRFNKLIDYNYQLMIIVIVMIVMTSMVAFRMICMSLLLLLRFGLQHQVF